jgi:purine-binding chemotaxis protein CheW
MNLAKIRKKARQEQDNRHLVDSSPVATDRSVSTASPEYASAQQVADEDDFFQNVEPLTENTVFPEIPLPLPPSQRGVLRDPLEAILAGREAAGCGENLPLASKAQTESEPDDYLEFLCFKVSKEVYGVDIMDIKELIKPRVVTEVPRTPSFVSGIISLRGVIIPIIDMLDRLGLAREPLSGRERVIVVRQADSFCGLLVDEIIQVARIAIDNIESPPPVLEGIDRDFVSGIGRSGAQMVILLNLQNITDIHLY